MTTWLPEMVRMAVRLKSEGVSYTVIAKTINMSYNTDLSREAIAGKIHHLTHERPPRPESDGDRWTERRLTKPWKSRKR